MPYQVSWQSVSMKSQTPVHVLGADADGVEDVPAGDLAATTSAVHAPLAVPAAARIVAANMPSFVMAAPCLNTKHRDLKKVSCKTEWGMTRKFSIRVAAAPQRPEGQSTVSRRGIEFLEATSRIACGQTGGRLRSCGDHVPIRR